MEAEPTRTYVRLHRLSARSGDGWQAIRRGRVLAFMGANLMKFGPVLGDRLAGSVLAGDIHPDLAAA